MNFKLYYKGLFSKDKTQSCKTNELIVQNKAKMLHETKVIAFVQNVAFPARLVTLSAIHRTSLAYSATLRISERPSRRGKITYSTRLSAITWSLNARIPRVCWSWS